MEIRSRPATGFTLIELLVSLLVVAILLAVGIPSYRSLRQEQILKAATQAVYTDIMLAKSEAIKRNKQLTIKLFNAGLSNWCYRIDIDGTCNGCDDTSCPSIEGRKGANADEFSGVLIDATSNIKTGTTASITFTPRRNTFVSASVTLINDSSVVRKIALSNFGRVRTCVSGETGC